MKQPTVLACEGRCRGSAEIPNHPHCPHLPTNNSTFQLFANLWNGFAHGPSLCHKHTRQSAKNMQGICQASYVTTQPYQMLTACTMSFWIPPLKVFPDVLLKTENYTQISPCLITRILMTGNVGALNALNAKLIRHDSRATPENRKRDCGFFGHGLHH